VRRSLSPPRKRACEARFREPALYFQRCICDRREDNDSPFERHQCPAGYTSARMYPFIHVGPLQLGTYGIFVAIGLLVAFFVMQKDLRRRGLLADPNVIVGLSGLAGLVGARLYHLLGSPAEFFADPWPQLFSTMGFAWFGSVIAGFVTLILIARHYKIPWLRMLDVASPAAAMGYGIGRIGCLISGDGDYGRPTSLPWGMSFPNGIIPTTDRVHPTPIYEFLASLVIFYVLWKLGARWMG